MKRFMPILMLMAMLLTMFGCGGSGSSAVPTTTITGTVFAGPATGATVTAKTTAGVVVATTSVAADANGAFSIAIPTAALAGDLIFETSGAGATFTDEATGASTNLGTLSVFVPAGTLFAGANVTLDPSSTIVQKLIAGGKTRTAAFTAFSSSFGYKPDFTIRPAFANVSSAATTPQRLAGFRAAAFSQLTNDLKDPATSTGIGGAAKQFELLQAIADDLSDGVLDGRKSGGTVVKTASNFTIPEDILNQYNAALISFQNSSSNKSKLTPAQINVPISGKVSLTPTYRVEYVPPTGGEFVSADTFQLKITNRIDGTPATGLASSIVLNPYMVMGAMGGGTHWPNAVTEISPGVYSGTVHYSMETYWGLDMYWKLYVFVGSETAFFYPRVAAFDNMDTVSVSFYNSSDTTTGTSKRRYRLWRDGLSAGAGGKYNLTVFLSTTDGSGSYGSITSSNGYPVYPGQSWTTAPLALSSVKVQAYDGTAWVDLTPVGTTGQFTASGLGLTGGIQGKVYVRLIINGTTYTNANTGAAWDSSDATTSNGVQSFTVTP